MLFLIIFVWMLCGVVGLYLTFISTDINDEWRVTFENSVDARRVDVVLHLILGPIAFISGLVRHILK